MSGEVGALSGELGAPCHNGCKNGAAGIRPCRAACRRAADAALVRDGLPVLCMSCGRALANVGEWCCGRFATAADVGDLSTRPAEVTP